MAFPTTAILDNFNRADQGPQPSASWTADIRGEGFAGFPIVSNQIVGAAGVETSDWWNAASFTDDNEAYVTCTSANPDVEVWARGTSPGSTTSCRGYIAWCSPSDSTIKLLAYGPGSAGGYTTISSVPGTIASGDKLGISCIGTTITVWKKTGAGAWTSIISVTDTTYAHGTRVGLLSRTASTFDDFGGGTASLVKTIAAAGSVVPGGSLAKSIARRLLATVTPGPGVVTVTRARLYGGGFGPAGALATVKTLAPIVIPPFVYPAGMDEMLYAALPWPEAQVQLAMPGVEGNPIAASCGWYGQSFDPHVGSFAIVARDGPLADMVGERLALTRRDTGTTRTVYVYCLRDSDQLTEDISLTRRAFMGLGDPPLDDVPVVVDTVGAQ